MGTVIFLSSPELWSVQPDIGHPLKPQRLRQTFELLSDYGAFDAANVEVISPRSATDEEIAQFHTPAYIDVVNQLSRGEAVPDAIQFGLGTTDNPIFEGMKEAESLKVGGALQAAELLWKKEAAIAFSYGGGMHHGFPGFASGFCIFNDAAIAIRWLVEKNLKVAYLDLDVHHGDGVQQAFYESDRVLTISLHQDGRTLFPGTGAIAEIGRGKGVGYSVNLPFPPGTTNRSYLWAFSEIVPPLLERFQADLIVTQLGVDTHYSDPLAELALTTRAYEKLYQKLSELAIPWLALGGGGYNLDVVPRAWTLAFGAMSGQNFDNHLPLNYQLKYGCEFLRDMMPPKLESERLRDRVETMVEAVKTLHYL